MNAFAVAEEHEAFRNVVRDFATAEIAPHAEAWDRDHTFPTDTVKAMGDLGLFGLMLPEEYGGSGADLTTLCIAIEEIGRADQSMGITLEAGVSLGAKPIAEYGTDEQKARYLPDLATGQRLAGFGLTEPDGGSDAGATKTRAELDASGPDAQWVINGAKTFITNSGTDITSLVTVTAQTEAGISSIIVPSGTPGFVVEPAYRKMGWHASDTHGLVFDDCRVPEENLLGEAGRGFHQFLATLDDGRNLAEERKRQRHAVAGGLLERSAAHDASLRRDDPAVRKAEGEPTALADRQYATGANRHACGREILRDREQRVLSAHPGLEGGTARTVDRGDAPGDCSQGPERGDPGRCRRRGKAVARDRQFPFRDQGKAASGDADRALAGI